MNFLISIREDALAQLDRFKGRIPTLFDNYLRIEHLDRKAAQAAIEKPIERYNSLYAADGQQISIEPELVEAVLEQVKTGEVVVGEAGRGVVGSSASLPPTEVRIETPYLQLVISFAPYAARGRACSGSSSFSARAGVNRGMGKMPASWRASRQASATSS